MKVSPEAFGPIYKVILHLTPLLAEQHELMTFGSEPNAIHRAGGDYTSTKHRPSALGGERMRRPESCCKYRFRPPRRWCAVASCAQRGKPRFSWHAKIGSGKPVYTS